MSKLSAIWRITLVLGLCGINLAHAQSSIPINCGDIVEVETNTTNPYIDFNLQASAGTTLNMRAEPLGSTLLLRTSFYDSGGTFVFTVVSSEPGAPSVIEQSVIASSNPTIAIGGTTLPYDGDGYKSNFEAYGAFTVYVGCTLRDGTVIAPGDTAVANSAGGAPQAVPFSGFGFPGLLPIDFTNAIAIPFQMGDVPNVGSIAPGFESVFGFSFEGSAGDTFALDFARLSGNMSLNLTVLSVNNEVAYQASLVTSSSMSSTFTLPSSGTYTVGVSKSTVGAPASPENTIFQLTGTLNP